MIKEDTQRKWKKSRDTSRADTTDLWRAEKVALLAKPWKVLNQLNSASELSCTRATFRGHGIRSHVGVTWRGHVQRVSKLPGVICIYKWFELYSADFSRVKRRCQVVVRLKANKRYQELLCYLSSYINLLNIRLCLGLWSLRKCYWQCNHTRICPDCIADYIALIIDLIVERIARAVSLIASLWLYLCSKVFFAFGIIFINYFSSWKRHKTELSALMNYALTFHYSSGSINGNEVLDHLELCLDLFPFPHYLQALSCKVAPLILWLVFHYQRKIILYSKESNGRN